MEDKYHDMYHRTRPESRYPKMSLRDRAAQFSPFAALTGHKEAIQETARITDVRPELDENMLEVLDYTIQQIQQDAKEALLVQVRYFVEDSCKSGGHYEVMIGRVERYDAYTRELVFSNRRRIPVRDIVSIIVMDDR